MFQNRFYLADVWRERLEFPDLKRRVIQSSHDAQARLVLIEDTGSGTALIQSLGDEASINVVPFQSKLDKMIRAQQQTAAIEAGKVLLPSEAPWLGVFDQEVLGFPGTRHDDQVDSMVQFLIHMSDRAELDLRSIDLDQDGLLRDEEY